MTEPHAWERTMGSCPTCEALARTVMLDQTSHDTKPFEWQGLTDDDVHELTKDVIAFKSDVVKFIRETEAKLKEKNGG